MTDSLTLAIAQIDPIVGDVRGNAGRILSIRAEAAEKGADLVLFSELVLSGYPPEDLMFRESFLDAVERGAEQLAAATSGGGPALLIGVPWRVEGKLYNAALLLDRGAVAACSLKRDLPNYSVFDEKRIFASGPFPVPVNFQGVRLGIMICEDMWSAAAGERLVDAGAEILVVINGSPFEVDKHGQRLDLALERVSETHTPLVYVNQVGGQDELVFDGASFVLGSDGSLRLQLPSWRENLTVTKWRRGGGGWTCAEGQQAPPYHQIESIYQALILGLRDYVEKNAFPGVLLGLSGGVDSALSAALAVDALGADRVHCVMMPSPYTSRTSLEDARAVAERLGIVLDEISIVPAMEAFSGMLSEVFAGHTPDITEENVQARARGLCLMAISNRFGFMVLSTGNKSEMSVGYATLYGDMCGGFSVLKDVYKTTVFMLCRWRNENKPEGALGPDGAVIPERIITKPPSAELKPGQTDQDTLPPYEELDEILHCLVEADMSKGKTIARGHDPETVVKVWRMLLASEYKRRQAPPGVRISRRAFGRDRRYPITNKYRGPE